MKIDAQRIIPFANRTLVIQELPTTVDIFDIIENFINKSRFESLKKLFFWIRLKIVS